MKKKTLRYINRFAPAVAVILIGNVIAGVFLYQGQDFFAHVAYFTTGIITGILMMAD